MKLSIVSTLYCSAPYTGEFHARASAAAEAVAGNDYEILLVNDGSPDEGLNLAIVLTRDSPEVTIVDLSRSFGHHRAVVTGSSTSSACSVEGIFPNQAATPYTIVRQVHGGRRNDHPR